MNKLSLIGSCQQVVIINENTIESHVIEAQYRLLYIARLVCHTQSICLVVEDIFKKETQQIVGSFSDAKKAPKRKTSNVVNKKWSEAIAASDKGSYSEQDKLLELDGLDKEEDEVVYGVKNCNIILFADLQIHGRFSARCYTRTSLKF